MTAGMMIDYCAYNIGYTPLKHGVLLTKIKIQSVPHSKQRNAHLQILTISRYLGE
jgi:hypothetical protein